MLGSMYRIRRLLEVRHARAVLAADSYNLIRGRANGADGVPHQDVQRPSRRS